MRNYNDHAIVIRELCERAYLTAAKNGFHERLPELMARDTTGARHILSWLMLIVTEVAEAAEEVRHFGTEGEFAAELADICIRVFDCAAALDIDLGEAIVRKMSKNENRPHKHGKRV